MKFIHTATLAALTVLCVVLPASAEWVETNEVKNPKSEEYYGYSLALSPNFLAVSAPYDDNEFGDKDSGLVHIYRRTDDNSLDIDHEIYGQEEGEAFGYSIDIAADSDILVIGAPMDTLDDEGEGVVRVFAFDDIIANGWSQLGQDIRGRELNEQFGQTVSISDDGNIICVGAGTDEETAQQRVDVYHVNRDDGGAWDFAGEIKIPDANESEDLDAIQVDIVQNGDEEEYYVAVSSGRFAKGKGVVMVFQITVDHLRSDKEDFQLVGRRLVGEVDHDELGESISLGMNDGTIYLAVGVPCTGYYSGPADDEEVSSDGRVEVYTFEASSVKDPDARWKLSSTIDQIENEDGTGQSVVISRDGLRLVVGSPKFNSFTGAVRVFDYHKGDFTVVGEQFFLGENKYQGFGSTLAMNGLDLVVSAPYGDYVKMYRFDGETHYGKTINGRRGRSGFVTFILVVFIMSIIGAVGYCVYVQLKQGRISLPSWRRMVYTPTPTENRPTIAHINQHNSAAADRPFSNGGLGLPSEDPIEADGVELMGARKTNDDETREMT